MLTVKLSHASNPDIDGGYWQEGNREATRTTAEVKTLKHASVACSKYISENGLGGGNWTGGQVLKDGKQIARVSYNGRLWDNDDNNIDHMANLAA